MPPTAADVVVASGDDVLVASGDDVVVGGAGDAIGAAGDPTAWLQPVTSSDTASATRSVIERFMTP